MPLWRFYHSADKLDNDDKAAIARGATEFYARVGLPDYYVHVIFNPVSPGDYYNGGTQRDHYVVLTIDHVAREISNDDHEKHAKVKDAVDAVVRPITSAKGLHFEFAVFQAYPFMWRVDGIDPPEAFAPTDTEGIARAKSLLKEKFGY